MRAIVILTLFFLAFSSPLLAQDLKIKWVFQESGGKASIRGLQAVDSKTAWYCDSDGNIARTVDGGANWVKTARPKTVARSDPPDFRDVAAFDSQNAWIMSAGIGESSKIYRTGDGGQSWKTLLRLNNPKGFLDSIHFQDSKNGYAVSDPIDDRLFLLKTENGGEKWRRIPPDLLPPLQKGEYLFAASGTCIATSGSNIWVATGGSVSRVFHSRDGGASWKVARTPISSGSPSKGVFSIAFLNSKQGIIVGGDYEEEKKGGASIAWTEDGGGSWMLSKNIEKVGFRSCIAWLNYQNKPLAIAVGPAGSSYSFDYGKSWSNFTGSFHVISVGAGPNAVWAAGANGRIGKLSLP